MTSTPTTEPAAPPKTVKPKAQGIEYIVLTTDTDGLGAWTEAGILRASNAQAAIRHIAGINGNGTYVAVPKRSWVPIAVKTETVTRVKLEAAP